MTNVVALDDLAGEVDDEYVRDICSNLLANNPSYTEQFIETVLGDEEWGVLAEAMKRNTTLEKLHLVSYLDEAPVNIVATTSLAAGVAQHPKLKELHFEGIIISSFGPISIAIEGNPSLNRLHIESCQMTGDMEVSLNRLLAGNVIESLVLADNSCEEDHPLDISRGLGGNQSLKDLTVRDCDDHVDQLSIASPTFRALLVCSEQTKVSESLRLTSADLQTVQRLHHSLEEQPLDTMPWRK